SWFNPDPFFAVDVKNWKPGEALTIDDTALSHPMTLSKIAKGKYSIQAVMDLDRGGRSFARSPGNVYSKTVRQDLDPDATGPVGLVLDQVVEEKPLKETERVKWVDIES